MEAVKRIAAALALLIAFDASAQSYPTKPVRLVLPFGPGGVADITARTIAPKMGEALGQQVVVENMPSAGGIRASEAVAKAEPDGHTILLLTNGNAVSQALFKSLPYDPINDFAMISTVGAFSLVVVTRSDGPYKTLKDVISAAKANPNKLNFGSIAPGSTQHLAAELLRTTAGVDVVVVPHKTTGEVTVAAVSGGVDIAVEFITPMMSSIRAGTLRALAVTAGKRFAGLPDVPTVAEAGVPGYTVTSWNALAAPAKTPKAAIDKVRDALDKALADPAVQKRFADLGVDGKSSSSDELRAFFLSEAKRWTQVVERSGIPKQ